MHVSVTAAHCVKHFAIDEMKVKVGEYDFKKVGETNDKVYDIRRVVIHEAYNDTTYDNDIAIIQLRLDKMIFLFVKGEW